MNCNLRCDRCGDKQYSASPQMFTGNTCRTGCGGHYVYVAPTPRGLTPNTLHHDKGEGNHH